MSAAQRELLTPEEARARDAVRALPRPTLDPAFRARLAEDFASGRIESAPRARMIPLPWHRRAMTRWGAAAVAAAAAVLVVSALNQGPEWRVTSIRGTGMVVLDGEPVPSNHLARLQSLLKPGVFVQLPDNVTLEIASRGLLALQLTGGAQASVPQPPGRWFQRRAVAEVRGGEVRAVTGHGFHGARLAVTTPDARVEVTGTALAIICEPTGTCVCVYEGRVRMRARAATGMAMVEAGRRRYVFSDGRPDESAPMRPTEHVALAEFRERMRGMMGGR
jgi:ferric-dicitrate binding protein FerR (iron transport regulator)